MTFEEQVLEKIRSLPPHKQREVLAFVSHLQEESGATSRHTLLGLWNDLGVEVTESDIEQARHEMWQQFPRNLS